MSIIDFNQAEQQTEMSSAIPEDSVVPFKMTIRAPKKQGSQHPLFNVSAKGNEYIDVEFECMSAAFGGKKVWQNFTLYGSDQATKISMRTLRAIVESARGIDPNDASPQATEGRKLADFADFNGMVFLAKVKCVVEQSPRDGKWYINNEFKKIITPDMPEYHAGEQITNNPLPQLPEGGAATPAAPTASAAWGAPAAASVQSAPAPAPAAAPAGMPTWAMK